jgi:hypothetical protein
MWNSSPSSAKSSKWSHQNSQAREEKTRLPDNFTPSPYAVLIRRGKACAEAIGNKRLKVIVSTYLNEYLNAPNRISCSIIVSKIVDIFREAHLVGSFVKKRMEHGGKYQTLWHVNVLGQLSKILYMNTTSQAVNPNWHVDKVLQWIQRRGNN